MIVEWRGDTVTVQLGNVSPHGFWARPVELTAEGTVDSGPLFSIDGGARLVKLLRDRSWYLMRSHGDVGEEVDPLA